MVSGVPVAPGSYAQQWPLQAQTLCAAAVAGLTSLIFVSKLFYLVPRQVSSP